MQSVGQKKTKTLRKRSNATITRVLDTSGANYKISLNRESEISIWSFTLTDHQEVLYHMVGIGLPDDPLRWNFSRRFPTRDLS